MLVETVTGLQTVKATALEPAFGKRWDNQLAAYVSASKTGDETGLQRAADALQASQRDLLTLISSLQPK